MQINYLLPENLITEIHFKATRSSGKGGQNVNKVSTKVILIFDIEKSGTLNNTMKSLLKSRLGKRITSKGELRITVSKERSQARNRKTALLKFLKIIEKALQEDKVRIPTRPLKSASENRLKNKAHQSDLKKNRVKKIDQIE
jgi:ribosome-associated protein